MLKLLLFNIFFQIILCNAAERISVENMEIQVKDVQSNKFLGKLSLKSEEKFPKLLRLQKNYLVQLSFSVVDASSKKPINDVQQAFLRFFHSKTADHEVFFVAKMEKQRRMGEYSVEILMSRDAPRFGARPGKYACELIVGDKRIREGYRWQFIDAFVDVPKQIVPERRSYEPRNKLPKTQTLPEIEHKFKKIETCNFNYMPIFYIFTVICALPLIFFFKMCCPLFKNVTETIFTTPQFPSAQIFIGSICSIFALYVWSWIYGIGINQIYRILPLLGIICFLSGHKTLKFLAWERMENEPEIEEIEMNEMENESEFAENSLEETSAEEGNDDLFLDSIMEENGNENF